MYNTTTSEFNHYNGTTWQPSNYVDNNDVLAAQSMGSEIKATPVFTSFYLASGVTMNNQQQYFNAIWVSKKITATGVLWYQTTQGSYTGNNYNGVALYSQSSGSLTLLASSTNDTEIWKAATGSVNKKTFSLPVTIEPGLYYLSILYSSSAETTAPVIGSCPLPNTSNVPIDGTNGNKPRSFLTSQTSLAPTGTSMTTTTTSGAALYIALY